MQFSPYLQRRRTWSSWSCGKTASQKPRGPPLAQQSDSGSVGASRVPFERQKSFPKSYVESTHRHDWLEKFREGEDESAERQVVEEEGEDGFVVVSDAPDVAPVRTDELPAAVQTSPQATVDATGDLEVEDATVGEAVTNEGKKDILMPPVVEELVRDSPTFSFV